MCWCWQSGLDDKSPDITTALLDYIRNHDVNVLGGCDKVLVQLLSQAASQNHFSFPHKCAVQISSLGSWCSYMFPYNLAGCILSRRTLEVDFIPGVLQIAE